MGSCCSRRATGAFADVVEEPSVPAADVVEEPPVPIIDEAMAIKVTKTMIVKFCVPKVRCRMRSSSKEEGLDS